MSERKYEEAYTEERILNNNVIGGWLKVAVLYAPGDSIIELSLTYQECVCIIDACQVWWLRRRAGHEVAATTFDLWRGLIAPYHALYKQEQEKES